MGELTQNASAVIAPERRGAPAPAPTLPGTCICREELDPRSFQECVRDGAEAVCRQAHEQGLPAAELFTRMVDRCLAADFRGQFHSYIAEAARSGDETAFGAAFTGACMRWQQIVETSGLSGDYMNSFMRPTMLLMFNAPGDRALAEMCVPELYTEYAARKQNEHMVTDMEALGLLPSSLFKGQINQKNYDSAAEVDTLVLDIANSVRSSLVEGKEIDCRGNLARYIRAQELIARSDFKREFIKNAMTAYNTLLSERDSGGVHGDRVLQKVAEKEIASPRGLRLSPLRKPEEVERIACALDQILSESDPAAYPALRRAWRIPP